MKQPQKMDRTQKLLYSALMLGGLVLWVAIIVNFIEALQ